MYGKIGNPERRNRLQFGYKFRCTEKKRDGKPDAGGEGGGKPGGLFAGHVGESEFVAADVAFLAEEGAAEARGEVELALVGEVEIVG